MSQTHYHPLHKALHWLMALMIVGLFALGLIMHELESSPLKFQLYGLHKSFGMTLLALVLVRLGLRFFVGVPPLAEGTPRWQRFAAEAAHWGLYGLMAAVPLSGWVMSSTGGYPVAVFGLFTLPDLVGPNKELHEALEEVHELLAFSVIGLAVVHAAAAFHHHVILKDETLRRMLPGKRVATTAVAFAAVIGLAALSSEITQASMPEQAPEWKVDPAKSSIAFTVKVNGAPVQGNFSKFSSTIRFDPENLDGSFAQVRVDTTSISMNNKEAVSLSQGSEWLATKNHAEAIFQSTRFEKKSGKEYLVHGDLWIKGKKVPSTLNIRIQDFSDTEAEIEGDTLINRKDFAVGDGQWSSTGTVGDQIQIRFIVAATR